MPTPGTVPSDSHGAHGVIQRSLGTPRRHVRGGYSVTASCRAGKNRPWGHESEKPILSHSRLNGDGGRTFLTVWGDPPRLVTRGIQTINQG